MTGVLASLLEHDTDQVLFEFNQGVKNIFLNVALKGADLCARRALQPTVASPHSCCGCRAWHGERLETLNKFGLGEFFM